VSVDDGQATVDLGALDGIEKGSELQVFRGRDDSKAVGRVTIATVFRERSRGEPTPTGALQAGDRVAVALAVHLAALLEQASARMASGDTKAARSLAERAVSTAQASGVRADSRRRALEQLGTFEHRDGALDAAAQHLQSAVNQLDVSPAATAEEQAEVLNELGAVLIERGNHAEAEKILRRAEPRATGAIGAQIANNLGVLAALRGDSVSAESLYRSALALAGNSPEVESDRRAIRENLEKLKAPR
jgi:Tfp pilus assembly protein PilF